jgi:long-chain fatty acid transport protein
MRTSIVRRVRVAALFGASVAALVATGSHEARATTVLELGDNGSEQMARGGAWVARASDPLATFYNPAGLAGQETRLTVQVNANIQNTCFTRIKATNDTTTGDGVAAGGTYPKVCSNGSPFPDPTIAFAYRLTPRIGLGLAILGPSAAGAPSWPDTVNGNPAPQRYLLLSANTLLLTPTLGIGVEPVDHLRLGLGLVWGAASVDFKNDSLTANQTGAAGLTGGGDVQAELKAHTNFIPGLTAGVLYSPVDSFDVAAWYKYMSPINAKGDIVSTSGTGNQTYVGSTAGTECTEGNTLAGANVYNACHPNAVSIRVPIPMEAKLGFRYHMLRRDADMAHRRDPMSQDVFDLEADLTWAHDSQFQQIGINIPANIPVVGLPSTFPTNADVPHNFKDVYGVHLGGDYNVLPDQLAVRAGTYFQTAAQSSEWQNIDFVGQTEIGIAAGATYRVHFNPEHKNALEISVGLGHTFIGTSTDNGNNPTNSGLKGLAGTACNTAVPANAGQNTAPASGVCGSGSQAFRSEWPVNLGTITNSFTQINLGLSYRF